MGEEAVMSENGAKTKTITYPLWQTHPKITAEEEWRVYDRVLEAQQAPEDKALTAATKLRDVATDAQLARIAMGDASLLVRDKVIKSISASEVMRVGLHAKYRLLVAELAGENPSAIEAMLADAAAMSWLDFMRCQWDVETLGEVSLRKATYYEQRADRAHKRLMRSLRSLAAVRRVNLQSITVNVQKLITSKLGPLMDAIDAGETGRGQIEEHDE